MAQKYFGEWWDSKEESDEIIELQSSPLSFVNYGARGQPTITTHEHEGFNTKLN